MHSYERVKASMRVKAEHPFHVLKNLLGHRKARYRGLPRNVFTLRLGQSGTGAKSFIGTQYLSCILNGANQGIRSPHCPQNHPFLRKMSHLSAKNTSFDANEKIASYFSVSLGCFLIYLFLSPIHQ